MVSRQFVAGALGVLAAFVIMTGVYVAVVRSGYRMHRGSLIRVRRITWQE